MTKEPLGKPTQIPTQEWNLHWRDFDSSAHINPAQAYRRELVIKAIAEGLNDRIADLGCGQGDLLWSLRQELAHAQFLGVDASDIALHISKSKLSDLNVCQANIDSEASPPQQWLGWADTVTCTEVLEHLDHPERAVLFAKHLLKSGGRLIVTVPSGPVSAFDKHLGHRKHYSIHDLRHLLETAGFKQIEVKGSGFPFFNVYRLVVVARGQQVIADAAALKVNWRARIAMFLFSVLFKLNCRNGQWGWQLIATATRS